jgi:Fe2+ transport system protein B
MIKFDKKTKVQLLELWNSKKIGLEGNLLKIIDAEEDEEFRRYIDESTEKDKSVRRKRLDLTKQIQSQNRELLNWKEENERIQSELRDSLKKTEESMIQATAAKEEADKMREEAEQLRIESESAKESAIKAKLEAEQAKNVALTDLDVLQKKTQFELISVIVKFSLGIIIGVGIITTILYMIVLLKGLDNPIVSSAWSNLFGILLTNSFSIIATIMGIKYSSNKKE